MDLSQGTTLVLVICAFLRLCESLKMFQTIRNTTGNASAELMANYSSYEDKNDFFRQNYPVPDDVPVECKKLKAKKYLSDGHCYSHTPIVDDVCVGSCLPLKEQNLPWWSEFYKYWSKNKLREYRCVEDRVRRKKVTLYCRDGTVRFVRIKVVKSCKCKAYTRDENKTKKKRKNRKDRNRRRKSRRERGRRRHRRHRKRKNRNHRRKKGKVTSVTQTT